MHWKDLLTIHVQILRDRVVEKNIIVFNLNNNYMEIIYFSIHGNFQKN